MSKYFYDLHIHSCLSPCADDDMTPCNIAGMGSIKGLTLMALTDHNSSRNCPAFFAACRAHGIVPVAGMELTTAEDVHMVCLFPDLESALDFDSLVYPGIMPIDNRPEIFGNQYVMDENDEIKEIESKLLISASSLDISAAIKEVRARDGVCYPAHIDRNSNGIIAMLGELPAFYGFTCAEFNDHGNVEPYKERYPLTKGLRLICSSDAHYLWDISEAEHSIEIEGEPYSSAIVRKNLIFNLLHNN